MRDLETHRMLEKGEREREKKEREREWEREERGIDIE